MIHTSLSKLDPEFGKKAAKFLARCQSDPFLISMGVVPLVMETLRDLCVQMAYAVKARIRSLPTDEKTDLQWVQDFFKAAGLSWIPTASENTYPSTWTLKSKHLDGKAIDVAASKDGKNPWWTAPEAVWKRMAEISKECGMNPGYYFKGKQDSPHHEEV